MFASIRPRSSNIDCNKDFNMPSAHFGLLWIGIASVPASTPLCLPASHSGLGLRTHNRRANCVCVPKISQTPEYLPRPAVSQHADNQIRKMFHSPFLITELIEADVSL